MRTTIFKNLIHSCRLAGVRNMRSRVRKGTRLAASVAVLSGGLTFIGTSSDTQGAITEHVTNGSFETNNGFNANNSGLGWETVEGTDLALGFDVYSHATQVYYTGPAPAGAGDWYFHSVGLGTLGGTPAVVEQVVDMTGLVGKNFRVGAQISGFSAPGDTATIDLSYWDAAGGASGAGSQIGSTITLDGTTGGGDGITDTWDFFTDTGQVPTGTVSASVRINQATATTSNGNDNYVDLVSLATLDGSFSILNLEVHKTTGVGTISMPSDAEEGSRDINFYEVISPNTDLLNTGSWQSLDGNLAGDAPGGTDWTVGGGSGPRLLTEANLTGTTEFAVASSTSLGSIYTGGVGGAEDLEFNYLVDGALIQGTVSYVSVPPGDGDFDSDGDVDGIDFLRWQRGDSPNNGSPGDLALWQANYPGPLSAVSAVPEPTSVVLVGIGLAGLAFTSRRRS